MDNELLGKQITVCIYRRESFQPVTCVMWSTTGCSAWTEIVHINDVHINDLFNVSNLIKCILFADDTSLGPKLFTLYVNDLFHVSNLITCILFADDNSLFCSDADINRLFERVSSVLASMCAINKLSLNVLKTCNMLFRNNTAIDMNGVYLDVYEPDNI